MYYFLEINLLSILGCLALFVGGYLAKESLTSATKLILLLGFSDLLYHISNLVTNYIDSSEDFLCNFFMFINMVASLTSLLWSSSIGFIAYLTLKNAKITHQLNMFPYITVAWILISIIYSLMYVFYNISFNYFLDQY